MKRYYVTVNGSRYEVEVEEVQGNFPKAPKAETVEQELRAHEPASEAVASQEASEKDVKKENPDKVTEAEGEKILCPMPGTIIKIPVSEGQKIKKGEVILVLEAMKMENEIMSPKDGTLVQIAVTKGQQANTGDLLAVIQ